VIAALIGAALGILVILIARAIRGEGWVYAIGLLVLPGLYAFFALRIGDQAIGLREMTYGLPFIAAGLIFAFMSVRTSALVVGSFWILHALYDLAHDRFITNPGVPDWYPAFCFSVDVVVGVYLLWLPRRLPNGNLREA
jgi:hypothetical protein